MASLTRRRFLIRASGCGAVLIGKGPGSAAAWEQPVRVGLAGLDSRGRRDLKALMCAPNVQIAALCDPDAGRLAMASDVAGGGSRAYATTSMKRMLTQGKVDLVVVNVPEERQLEVVDASVRQGKHVAIGGPAFSSAENARALAAIAMNTPASIQCIPHDPGWDKEELISILRSAAVGTPRRVSIREVTGWQVRSSENETLLDQLEVACAVLGTGMPARATAMAAGGDRLAAQLTVEIQMEGDCAQSVGLHRMRAMLAEGLEKVVTFGAEGPLGTLGVVVETWRGRFSAEPAAWRRIVETTGRDRAVWRTASRQTAAVYAMAALLRESIT